MQKDHINLHPHFSNFFADPLFMTREAYVGFMTQLMFSENTNIQVELPSYEEETVDMALKLSSNEISVTRNFSETDIPDHSIAFHRIVGTIFAEYDRWGYYFSTKQLIDDIRAAERNPQIVAHFLFANTGGGEAWYLEKAYQAVGECKKPVIAFVEKRCCSAGTYLIINSNRIFSTSLYDTHGSIGTMVAFLDIIPYFEKMGAKWIEEYADQSKKKNKKFNDLINGKPEQYKKQELNPLAEQFIKAVRTARPLLGKLPESHDVFAGETYYSQESQSIGLIDQIADIDVAINYALEEGKKYKSKIDKQQKMHTYIN